MAKEKTLSELQEEYDKAHGIYKTQPLYSFDEYKPFNEMAIAERNEVFRENEFIFNLLCAHSNYCFDDLKGYDEQAKLKSIISDLENEIKAL